MTVPPESSSGGTSPGWLFKNKDHGKASAAASLVLFALFLNGFIHFKISSEIYVLFIFCRG